MNELCIKYQPNCDFKPKLLALGKSMLVLRRERELRLIELSRNTEGTSRGRI